MSAWVRSHYVLAVDSSLKKLSRWIRIHFHAKFADYMNMKAEDLSFIAPLDRKTGELDLAFVYEGLGLESYAVCRALNSTIGGSITE